MIPVPKPEPIEEIESFELDNLSFLKSFYDTTDLDSILQPNPNPNPNPDDENASSLRIRIVELEQKLRDEKTKYDALKSKFDELEFSKYVVSKEVEKLGEECERFKERERRMLDVLERKQREVREARRRGEEEVEVWKRKYNEVEAMTFQVGEKRRRECCGDDGGSVV